VMSAAVRGGPEANAASLIPGWTANVNRLLHPRSQTPFGNALPETLFREWGRPETEFPEGAFPNRSLGTRKRGRRSCIV
jgi:hypothetical protein